MISACSDDVLPAPAVRPLTPRLAHHRRAALSVCLVAAALALASVPASAQVAPLPQAAAPTFSVTPGSYPSVQSVSISDTTPGAVIYYTSNGAYPTATSAVYSTPIAVSQSEILVAVAIAPGYAYSRFSSAEYFIASSSSRFVYSLAGNYAWGSSGDGGPAAAAELKSANGTVVDKQGNIFIADSLGNVVRRVDGTTGIISTVAGTGIASDTGDTGPAINATLWAPWYLALDGLGNLFIGETGDQIVRKVNLGTGIITRAAGGGTANTGPATSLGLSGMIGLAADSIGNLYIGIQWKILAVDTSGNATQIASSATTPGFPLLVDPGFAMDQNRNFYVSSPIGPAIYKIDSTGTVTLFAGNHFPSGGDGGLAVNAGIGAWCGLAVDSAGNVYVGDSNNGAIRKIDIQTGIINTIAGVFGNYSTDGGEGDPATSVGMFPLYLSVDASGNIYEAYGGGKVLKITAPAPPPATAAPTPTFSLAPGSLATPKTLTISDSNPGALIYLSFDGSDPLTAGYSYHGPIQISGSANIRAVAVVAGQLKSSVATASYTVKQPPTAIISTVAGRGVYGFAGDGGSALDALLNAPQAIAFRSDGGFYIADSGNNVVRLVAAGSGIITTVAGNGSMGFSGDGGLATAAQLNYPDGLAIDSNGNLYIADGTNLRIRKVDAKTGIITTFAGGGTATTPPYGDGGPATSAFFPAIEALALDSLGNLYIADSDRVRIIPLSTSIINTFAGGGTALAPQYGDGGPATSARIWPVALALDANNNLYIADALGLIRLVDAGTHVITSVAGSGDSMPFDGILATNAHVTPTGVAVDAKNNVYFAGAFPSIRKIQPDGTLVRVAGNEYGGYSGDGGAATMASLYGPWQITFDASGNLYISDGNSTVRKVTFLSPAPAPYFNLAGGTYHSPQTLTLTDSLPGATIFYTYTANGTQPTTASPAYSGPITINSTGTVEAIAVVPGYSQSPIASKSYIYSPLPPAAAPYFNLAGGTYHSPQMLILTDSTPGAAIHYTANGTTPTGSSTLYTGPITIASTETVEAVAIATGYSLSPPASKAYAYAPLPPANAPSFSLAGGTYNTPQMLTLTDSTPGATIYYTTNGTTPTASSTFYTGPIKIASTETVEAVAIATGYSLSPISSKAYTYTPLPLAAAPYFSLAGGHYTTPQVLALADTTPGAAIYYTTNGTTPTTSSTLYTGPITISTTETIIAIAAAPGYANSNQASKAYTIP